MLDLKYIRENLAAVKDAARQKKCTVDFDRLTGLDEKRRDFILRTEELKCKQNKANDAIVELKRTKKNCDEIFVELKKLSRTIKDLDAELSAVTQEMNQLLLMIPNIPHSSVPRGGAEQNRIVREWGSPVTFDFDAHDHLTLAEKLGYLNMERAAKIAGSGFVLYQGLGARLERALINFMLDLHTQRHRYTEVSPPLLVNRMSMTGTGQLPKLEDDMYAIAQDDLFLIPTAEVPVTNIHQNDVLAAEMLPLRYVAYTPCFRREAGAYGKDTRGLSRVHQFNKVELVKFVEPARSYDELELLVSDAEAVLQALDVRYRVVMLAAGDLSFAAAKCYDLEIWAPASQKWFEVSSCSNFCDFQARRANIKYRSTGNKKPQFVHTLNGSGVALPRLVIALLENGQQKDGTITFPRVLAPYLQ